MLDLCLQFPFTKERIWGILSDRYGGSLGVAQAHALIQLTEAAMMMRR